MSLVVCRSLPILPFRPSSCEISPSIIPRLRSRSRCPPPAQATTLTSQSPYPFLIPAVSLGRSTWIPRQSRLNNIYQLHPAYPDAGPTLPGSPSPHFGHPSRLQAGGTHASTSCREHRPSFIPSLLAVLIKICLPSVDARTIDPCARRLIQISQSVSRRKSTP